MRLLIILAIMSAGCGQVAFNTKKDILSCTVETIGNESVMTCPDGTSAVIEDGTDGSNGIDGTNGLDGNLVALIDPCGDGPGEDEILIETDTGQFIAWYRNLGLVLLTENVNYITTDSQKCKFKIVNGQVEEL